MINEKEIRQALLSISGWENAPAEFLDYCLMRGRLRHYTAKQYLYFSGDEAKNFFILLKGRIQLLLTSEFNEKIFRVLRPPVFFPEIILDGKTYPQAALALEATDVLCLEQEALKHFLEIHPQLLWLFFRSLALDQRRSFRQIKNLSLGDARLRLGAKLYALAHAHGKRTPAGLLISIPLSATELASMCSLARESVSRILGELKQTGIINVDKKNITVHDPQALSKWVQERANLRNSL